MALLSEFSKSDKQTHSVHGPTECGYSIFSAGDKKYVQLDTYGSPKRKLRGKISQTIQLDRTAARHLVNIIKRAYPEL